MNSDKLRQVAVVFGVVSMIVMNYLSNARLLGGQTNGDISNKYHTLITPAGYAFAIWGVIFLGLLAFAVYQALPSQRKNVRLRAVGWLVILNTLCNAIWSPLFNNERIGTSVVVILIMFISNLLILEGLLARRRAVDVAILPDDPIAEGPVSVLETWVARVPFAIYFGWITIATILNITVYLKATNFNLAGISEATWAAGMLVVSLVIGTILFNRYRSVAYILVFSWAYVAISVEQKGEVGPIPSFAVAGAVVAALFAAWELFGRKEPVYA
ncbi:MAG: tryptophan-rich sensory protein [Bacteroidetes bacterium]|nr:tryptophan-rich sensory protein [Fibrella sp.]